MRANELVKAIPGKTTIYLDMDGVLADFFAEYAKIAKVKSWRDIPPAKVDPVLNSLMGTDFFATLPKFPTTDALVKMAISYAGSYSICSSPLRNDFNNSAYWKKIWIRQNLSPQPSNIEITSNKHLFAKTGNVPNILIDDKRTNIEAWRAAGGIGIKYQADENDLEMVKDNLDMYYGKLEEVDVRYSAFPKLTKRFTIGEPYGKKNLRVPHAKYVDKRTKK